MKYYKCAVDGGERYGFDGSNELDVLIVCCYLKQELLHVIYLPTSLSFPIYFILF